MESICRFSGSCHLHQNKFPDRSLCYIGDIAFVYDVALAIAAIAVAGDHYSFVQDNHVVR
jgi:hypothetical protein